MIDTRVNMMRNLTFIPNMGRSQKWSSFEMSSSSLLFTVFRWFNSWGNARTLLVWSCIETPAEVRRHFLQSRFVDASFSFLLFFRACVCVGISSIQIDWQGLQDKPLFLFEWSIFSPSSTRLSADPCPRCQAHTSINIFENEHLHLWYCWYDWLHLACTTYFWKWAA